MWAIKLLAALLLGTAGVFMVCLGVLTMPVLIGFILFPVGVALMGAAAAVLN